MQMKLSLLLFVFSERIETYATLEERTKSTQDTLAATSVLSLLEFSFRNS